MTAAFLSASGQLQHLGKGWWKKTSRPRCTCVFDEKRSERQERRKKAGKEDGLAVFQARSKMVRTKPGQQETRLRRPDKTREMNLMERNTQGSKRIHGTHRGHIRIGLDPAPN